MTMLDQDGTNFVFFGATTRTTCLLVLLLSGVRKTFAGENDDFGHCSGSICHIP